MTGGFANKDYYVPYFQVKVNGVNLTQEKAAYIKQITVEDTTEKADVFRLEVDNHNLHWLETEPDTFAEGNEVEIVFGYYNGKTSSICGEISNISYSFPASGAPTLQVTGYDLIHRLMRGKATKTYRDMKISDIVAQVANNAGLIPDVESTDAVFPNIDQKDQNDFFFVTALAEKLGFEFRVFKDSGSGNNTLYFKTPEDSKKENIALEWRKSLVGFQPKINISKMVKEVEVRGWDPANKEEIVAVAEPDGWVQNILSAKANEQVGKGSGGASKYSTVDKTVGTEEEAKQIAASIMKRIQNSIITGTGSCIGMPDLRAGTVIDIAGIGTKFSGGYYITSTTHTIGSGGYSTRFSVEKRS